VLKLFNLVNANLGSIFSLSQILILAQVNNLDISVLGRDYFLTGSTLATGRLSRFAIQCLS
jgi:hypothetical protein